MNEDLLPSSELPPHFLWGYRVALQYVGYSSLSAIEGGLRTTGKGVGGHEREEYEQAYLEGNKAGKEVEAAVKRYKSHRHTFTEEI